ncbi:uncharacterized protein LOC102155437 isoform X2 [Canis lupus familiaris]|uniref:uncharacterized protein LOC102155437 isoform X2 n=1 Tax=Canis lupus familiaris TaxID=9615 RepID=UPI000BAA1855|nr:uncharacterized protein LOC102155437 isoform X2 [Canis lupus familiaris]XP_038398015.1 uncharacterized protein LOC102155437 isoform X2 [Canis lupus familiaris]XP_038526866.1 uncharacterized protein LOC102155437 isoform X2 [Canis lupus familiaris]|eukprot:XP_022276590.1 uncharacterized protein LOC102155437 isoform X2 [Canis lupus familiaris]
MDFEEPQTHAEKHPTVWTDHIFLIHSRVDDQVLLLPNHFRMVGKLLQEDVFQALGIEDDISAPYFISLGKKGRKPRVLRENNEVQHPGYLFCEVRPMIPPPCLHL